MRPDFLDDCGCLLGNDEDTEFKFHRCIFMTRDKGPCVSTCREHNGGSRDRHIHVPRNPVSGSLLPLWGDCSCHASMQPRIVSPVRHKKHNVGHQVSVLRSGCQGMDTFLEQENGDFCCCSVIDSENENLHLNKRPDLKQHMHEKLARGDVPAWLGKSMLEASEDVF